MFSGKLMNALPAMVPLFVMIMRVVPSYGAIWSVCARQADPERGKTFQKKNNVLSRKLIMLCHKTIILLDFSQ
jgi:hypothetical protein